MLLFNGVFNMYISVREKLIVETLLDKSEVLSIKDLAIEIGVSPRTIHRDLKGIEAHLEEYELQLIRKTGVGIQIVGLEKSKEYLKQMINTLTFHEYSVDERLTMILSTLYESSEPVKLFTLAHELHVTIATISADITKLEGQLKQFHLSIVKRRGYGVELSGAEQAKRRAMSYMIAKSLKEYEFFSLFKESPLEKSTIQKNTVSERLLHLVDQKKLLIIGDVLEELKRLPSLSITANAYVGLLVHLALAIERIMLGEGIQMDQKQLDKLKAEPEFQIAEKVIIQLKSRFEVEIPEAEIGYITMHLQGAKLQQNEGSLLDASNLQTVMQAKKLTQAIQDSTGVDLMGNEALLEGLVTHLKPAIYRIQQDMGITNPLLQSIRKDYEDLFQIVKDAVGKVFPDMKIPDEEIGYLVMHFGSVLLGLKNDNNLTAYTVCSSGIGTSKMLSTQLRREIKEISEVKNVSHFELSELQFSDRDLIISTIHLKDFTGEYLIVSPFITQAEIKQIELYARRKMLIKQPKTRLKSSGVNVEEISKRMEDIHLLTGAISELLSGFQLSAHKEFISSENCIRAACNQLERQQIIQNAEVIKDALFEREAIGGIGIPDTKLALFHTRHEQVLKPSFTVHTLCDPIIMKAMDGTDMEVSHILILLSPNPYHEPGLEVLSLISTMIIENEQSIKLFESNHELKIHSYMATKFDQFINEK